MLGSDDKVSVCLPVFNGSDYLAGAIESVLAQSHQNLELLIVDDLSSDGSDEIAIKYAKEDSRIVFWRNEHNLGIFANYNECLKRVSGSFVKLFAQDDVLQPDCLKRLLAELAAHERVALVTAARAVINEKGERTSVERFFEKTVIIPGWEVIQNYVRTFVYRSGTPSQVMFRRSAAGAGFDTRYTLSGDIEYFFRILESGDYMYLDEVLVNFRRHGNSATVASLKDMSFVADALRLAEKYEHNEHSAGENEMPVRKAFIEGLIRKVNNAVYDRKIQLKIASSPATAHSGNDEDLNYERMACELLLYASNIKMQLEEAQATVRRIEQQTANETTREKQIQTQLESEIKLLKQQMNDLKNSSSWRITQPIRWLGRVLQ
jgi:glycosyltransferase involved in cell wall biosynthesis